MEITQAISDVLKKGDFILGGELAQFEREFACYCEVSEAVGVDSGGSALELALRAYGIGPGDEVILPAYTDITTALAVSRCGAFPILVDVHPDTWTLNPTHLQASISPATRAIIPVHLFGMPADTDTIQNIAFTNNLFVIEDACQAAGARYKGRRVGSLGHAAAFSFTPHGNLEALGDAGAITTDNYCIIPLLRSLRNLGQEENHHTSRRIVRQGYHRRLDTIHAAVLRANLPHLEDRLERNRQLYWQFAERIKNLPLRLPHIMNDIEPAFFQIIFQTPQRDELSAWLQDRDILADKASPQAIHLQPVYQELGYWDGSLPVSEALDRQVLTIPLDVKTDAHKIDHIADLLTLFFSP